MLGTLLITGKTDTHGWQFIVFQAWHFWCDSKCISADPQSSYDRSVASGISSDSDLCALVPWSKVGDISLVGVCRPDFV